MPARGSELRVCRGPGCTETFRPKQERQKYHTDNCRKRAWKARERRRQAAFVVERLVTPERVAAALEEYDRMKEEGEL